MEQGALSILVTGSKSVVQEHILRLKEEGIENKEVLLKMSANI
ncbi:MAG: hypothetical protein VYC40_04190 [Pseudomonadota bacterium]|nr:hypothetical protein [Pseudomonadota bacterium]